MPVKILLADKSITIQKVVEMLFSGKEYEVTCVSDGDSAFSEASRIVPDVVLADVDLPRIDGYTFAGRLRETPALANVPVILMLSRDDVYDAMKGKLAGLVDNIAKPFESQELIGKVKKALSAAPAPAPAPPTAAPQPKPAAAPPPPPPPVVEPPSPPKPVPAPPPPPRPAAEPSPAPRPQGSVPKDIFDIIEEAPAETKAPASPAPPASVTTSKADETESETFEVEPEYEVEPESEPDQETPVTAASPVASVVPAASEEEWGGVVEVEPEPEPVVPSSAMQTSTDAFDTAQLFGREPATGEEASVPAAGQTIAADTPRTDSEAPPSFDFSEPMPAEAEEALPLGQRAMDEMREGLGLGGEPARASDMHPDIVSFESLDMASRADHEDYTFAPPAAAPVPAAAAPASEPASAVPPRFREASDEMLKGVAREAIEKSMREILERVAWEVIPDLAERLIREEIERLKAEQK